MTYLKELLNLITGYEAIMLDAMVNSKPELYTYAKEMKEYCSEQLKDVVNKGS